MWRAPLHTCAQSLGLTFLPLRCIACQIILIETRPHQLCDACLSEFKPNTDKRCCACDLPHAHHACLRCPAASETIAQMRLPLEMTDTTKAVLEAGREPARADVWAQVACIIAADTQAHSLARQACYLVPIASDPERLQQRGFNPSGLLARHLARAWNIDVAYILKRTRPCVRQVSCKPNQRYQNMMAAFFCTARSAHTVVLVDDYVVTGATAHAAARALRAAGAKRIFVVGAARGKG